MAALLVAFLIMSGWAWRKKIETFALLSLINTPAFERPNILARTYALPATASIIQIETRHGEVGAIWAKPTGIENAPAIILFPGVDGRGLGDTRMQALASRFASVGFSILVPAFADGNGIFSDEKSVQVATDVVMDFQKRNSAFFARKFINVEIMLRL